MRLDTRLVMASTRCNNEGVETTRFGGVLEGLLDYMKVYKEERTGVLLVEARLTSV
jgi:hypothetical protein